MPYIVYCLTESDRDYGGSQPTDLPEGVKSLRSSGMLIEAASAPEACERLARLLSRPGDYIAIEAPAAIEVSLVAEEINST